MGASFASSASSLVPTGRTHWFLDFPTKTTTQSAWFGQPHFNVFAWLIVRPSWVVYAENCVFSQLTCCMC